MKNYLNKRNLITLVVVGLIFFVHSIHDLKNASLQPTCVVISIGLESISS